MIATKFFFLGQQTSYIAHISQIGPKTKYICCTETNFKKKKRKTLLYAAHIVQSIVMNRFACIENKCQNVMACQKKKVTYFRWETTFNQFPLSTPTWKPTQEILETSDAHTFCMKGIPCLRKRLIMFIKYFSNI